jgi:hypothetical protein
MQKLKSFTRQAISTISIITTVCVILSVGAGVYLLKPPTLDLSTLWEITKNCTPFGFIIGLSIGFVFAISRGSQKTYEALTGDKPKSPLEKLQEEFDLKYPHYAPKIPPPPPIPPEQKDNPYRYQ